jgi:hypothetical protein
MASGLGWKRECVEGGHLVGGPGEAQLGQVSREGMETPRPKRAAGRGHTPSSSPQALHLLWEAYTGAGAAVASAKGCRQDLQCDFG